MEIGNLRVSPEFQQDLAAILEMCVANDTDSVSITLDCGIAKLDVDMTFNIVKKEN